MCLETTKDGAMRRETATNIEKRGCSSNAVLFNTLGGIDLIDDSQQENGETVQCTLGRIPFNMLQPAKLECALFMKFPQTALNADKCSCSSSSALDGNQQQEEFVSTLKSKLKSLLIKHKGSTTHPDVLEVIKKLSEYSPARTYLKDGGNVFHSSLFSGEYITETSPNFPGRIKTKDDTVQYTLGRLSFNIFEPAKLVCTLLSVRNQVIDRNDQLDDYSTSSSSSSLSEQEEDDIELEEVAARDEKKERQECTYNFLCDIIIHTPKGDLPALLLNEGVCYPSDPSKNESDRVMVSFSSGTLMPAEHVRNDNEKLQLWEETFQNAYRKADKERSYIGTMFQSLLKWVLGLEMPTDDTLSSHSFHFSMKRAPCGYFDVLFLDEDIRITKGNKGTLVVVERDHGKALSKACESR